MKHSLVLLLLAFLFVSACGAPAARLPDEPSEDGGLPSSPDSGEDSLRDGGEGDGGGEDASVPDGGDGGSHEDGGTEDGGIDDGGTSDGGGHQDAGSDGGGEDGGFTSDGGEPDGGTAAERIRVLTFNLRTPVTSPLDMDKRTQAVIDFITAHQPDFVALQEVVSSSWIANRAEVIATSTTPRYDWTWKKSHAATGVDEGVAVLTRWPVSWRGDVALPHKDTFLGFIRIVVGVEVETAAGPLAFFSTHLMVDEKEKEKADQALAAGAFAESRTLPRGSFLAGDMNAKPDQLAMKVLRGAASHSGVSLDYLDGWLHLRPAEPGYTFPSNAPEKRIDYIYAVPGTESTPSPVSCSLVLDAMVNGSFPSDHVGVLCDFEVP